MHGYGWRVSQIQLSPPAWAPTEQFWQISSQCSHAFMSIQSPSWWDELLHLSHPEPCSQPNWATNTLLQAAVQDLLGPSEAHKPVRAEDKVLHPNELSSLSFDSPLSRAEGNGATPDSSGLDNLEAGPHLMEPALSAIVRDKLLQLLLPPPCWTLIFGT